MSELDVFGFVVFAVVAGGVIGAIIEREVLKRYYSRE
jgi:branched-subunit amino acid ABC-type transport system permease component